MPFCEADPWRLQFFENVSCPQHIRIPTEDADAYVWYPAHNWIYDKLRIALSQGIEAAPHGVPPTRFPVFSKPITNLKGMGVESRLAEQSAGLRGPLPARPHVDGAARRRARQHRLRCR